MSATIYLDKQHAHFTNLDSLTGKVVLVLHSEASISGIQVKLEGESRTRLPDNSERKRTEAEIHKILYKVVNVFPTPDLCQTGPGPSSWTFASGAYEYPFQFKIPFNNACNPHNSMLTNLTITGLKVEMARDSNQHVKKALPPSLAGFAGEAEIRYYVKATVIRPQFYKENIRAFVPINFLPIEPPRTGNPSEEMYARRQHQFSNKQARPQKKRSLFQKHSVPLFPNVEEPPALSVDTRLPNPPILTCNEPIPLRILVKKLNDAPETVFLQMLQIELIAYTHIRAHDLRRTQAGSWVIVSTSNMSMPLGSPSDPAGTEWTIQPGFWDHIPLPNTVAPSFETCNISRTYELEVRIGFTYGSHGVMRPQLIVLPLRMAVKVYSGIAPPQALLDAVAASAQNKVKSSLPHHPSRSSDDEDERPPMPPRPAAPSVPNASDDAYDDAPPSYEDAMAESLGPVDGPRREYNPPAASSARKPPETGADSKSPVDLHNDHVPRTVYGNISAVSSTETVNILSSSPESHSDSPPLSATERPLSTTKFPVNPLHNNPPQYQEISENTTIAYQQTTRRQQSAPESRPINLGVPNRKPVPQSPNRRFS